MIYSSQKKVACIGIGGLGVSYVARFFLGLGIEVYGFDITHSTVTEDLEKRGARITYTNPEGKLKPGTTLYVYSPALPEAVLDLLNSKNREIEHTDVGTFTAELVKAYASGHLADIEKKSVISSNIAPLFTLDQSKMKYIAVTGTDGKTTTCMMIFHLLKSLGYKPGLISTVSALIGEKSIDTGFHTTSPSPQDLYQYIHMMEDANCTHAIIEATSHGLSMGRLAGLAFDCVAYTNVTTEHLDYHKTWANYFDAKAKLVLDHLKQNGIAIVNADDPKPTSKLVELCEKVGCRVRTYGIDKKAELQAFGVVEGNELSFSIDESLITLPILGRYNVSNALAALLVVSSVTTKEVPDISGYLSTFRTVVGRMQVLQRKPFMVIVDFAHTARALEEALRTVRKQSSNSHGRVIVVFGCAGKRDSTKRYPMGAIAGTYADLTILTAEDPRLESLKDINDEIEIGWKSTASPSKKLIRFDDGTQLVQARREAIRMALSEATDGDVVIITGKAHEQSLCFGTTEYPWNDIDETRTLLKQ